MGREAECDSGGMEMEWKLGVGEARTPLRALIARESGGAMWVAGGADLASPGRKRGKSGSGSPVGSLFAASIGHVSHKIRLFKKAQAIAERPVQLGALFAREAREEGEGVALRELIAAEVCGGPVTDGRSGGEESQELRYLFAKDWALQTSDEEDEFWDSGSLCGAAPVRSRRRSRFYRSETPRPAAPEIQIVKVQELRVQSPRDLGSSLGTLLAEEIAASSGSPFAGPRWSSTPAAESSRRVKIGSLDDISAPVRPESQSQLDFLIAKILTLRSNSNNSACSDSRNNGGCSNSGSNRGCSATSGSMQTPADVRVGEERKETETTPATDVISSIAEAPNILLEAPTPPSTGVETPVTEAAEPLRDGGHEEATTSPDREDVEAQPRVRLGTLLERTWGEHGWLPLGRSPMGSPLPAPSHREEPPGPSPEAEPEAEPVEAPEPTVAVAEVSVEAAEARVEAAEACVEAAEASVEAAEASVEAAEASVEAAEASVEAGVEAAVEAGESRPPTRVSLLSLLNQDMETDEEGLQADVRGRRDEPEEDEVVTEELDPMCCVCMVGHKGAAFIPCGHTFCRKCCREVRRSIGSCPLCNQTIVDVLKLY